MTNKLCYIKDNTAYFTSIDDIKKQWGDDWNDAPYEHNAGTPYSDSDDNIIITKIMFTDANFTYPHSGGINSPYSVEQINHGATPWLSTWDKKDNIYAGASEEAFIEFVQRNEGEIFLPLKK